jgi:hypothetical protein
MANTQYCVVCGRGSTRSTWNTTNGTFVACDFHSIDEFNYAVSVATTPGPDVIKDNPSTDVSVAS